MTRKLPLILAAFALCCSCIIILQRVILHPSLPTIKLGILHSLTGDLAISERPVANATLLAIQEINATGGVLGRQIEPLLVDGASNEKIFEQQAERLISQEKVAVIFGCWTSPSRILVKNVVEKYNSLLIYPVQFEGLETSENVVYTSTTPNQQIIPGVTWCMQHLGKKFFLVGSDKILHEIIKDVIYAHSGTIVGIEYLDLDDKNINPIVQKIIETKPDVILNNIEGETNILFFNELRSKGITPEKIPTMSFSISEPELQLFNINTMTGDYATWSYFENIDTPENTSFVKRFKSVYGEKSTVSDAMEAAYFSVYLWKQALEEAGSTDINSIRKTIKNQAFDAPQGLIHIADSSMHTWSFTRVGKIRSDKQFSIVWNSQKSIQPEVYPSSRSIKQWCELKNTIDKEESAS